MVKPREGAEAKHAIRGIDTVLVHGFNQISTQAIRTCVEHGVGVHWLSVSGHHTASLVPTAGQVQRRVRQYAALTDPAVCLRLAKQLAAAKVEGQDRYLLRATRGDDGLRDAARPNLSAIQPLLARTLCVYLTDGRLTIDNAAAEQAIRPLAVGRRNWLHLGGDGGWRPTAVLLSICASIKRQGINPWAYFKHVLTEIPTRPPSADLTDLLPDVWTRSPARPGALPA